MQGYAPSSNGINFPSCAYAALPDATQSAGLAFFVPDAPAGASLVLSDGSNWRVFARGVVAMSYTLLSTDAGLATFAYALAAPPVPAITLEDPSGVGMLTFAIKTRTKSQVQVQVSRGQALPVIGSLLGLNTFTGGLATGVTVHFIGVPTP